MRTYLCLPGRGKTDQTNDSSMGQALNDSQFAEILIERDEYPVFRMRPGKYFDIAGITRPVTAPFDLVPEGGKLGDCAAPDATVKQKFQAASSMSGSIRSCSTTRWA